MPHHSYIMKHETISGHKSMKDRLMLILGLILVKTLLVYHTENLRALKNFIKKKLCTLLTNGCFKFVLQTLRIDLILTQINDLPGELRSKCRKESYLKFYEVRALTILIYKPENWTQTRDKASCIQMVEKNLSTWHNTFFKVLK